jgi:hypothetical protein
LYFLIKKINAENYYRALRQKCAAQVAQHKESKNIPANSIHKQKSGYPAYKNTACIT